MGKQEKLLKRMAQKPTPANIHWADIERLLIGYGAALTEGRGSRVHFDLNGVTFCTHRPHPQKEAKRYQVRDVVDFLRAAGVIK